jgi:hypothetical protein
MVALVRQAPWLPAALLALAVLLLVLAFFVGGLGMLFGIGTVVAVGLAAVLQLARRVPTVDEALGADLDKPEAIDHLGPGPIFVFGDVEEPQAPAGVLGGLFAQDNVAAQRFKAALKDWGRFATAAAVAGCETPRTKLDLALTSANVATALKPTTTIPRRFLASAVLAPHIRAQVTEVFDEIILPASTCRVPPAKGAGRRVPSPTSTSSSVTAWWRWRRTRSSSSPTWSA